MLDQNVTILLSAALGGLLAIAGGFLANYYVQITARKSEKRRSVREKIDEIYTLSTHVKTSFFLRMWHRSYLTQEQYNKIHLFSDEAARELNNIGERIEMLARLYVPSITSAIVEYSQQIKMIDHRIDNEIDTKGRRLPELTNDANYMKAVEKIQSDIDTIHRKLQSALEKQIEY